MEWISVKDRLPPKKEDRHLITDGNIIHYATFVHWMGDDEKSWTWILPSGMLRVTHWLKPELSGEE